LIRNWGLDTKLRPLLSNLYAYSNTFSAIYRSSHSNQLIIDQFIESLKQTLTLRGVAK